MISHKHWLEEKKKKEEEEERKITVSSPTQAKLGRGEKDGAGNGTLSLDICSLW